MSYVSGASRPEHSKASALGEEDKAASKFFCSKIRRAVVSSIDMYNNDVNKESAQNL